MNFSIGDKYIKKLQNNYEPFNYEYSIIEINENNIKIQDTRNPIKTEVYTKEVFEALFCKVFSRYENKTQFYTIKREN
jgi:hypothetical protein